MIWLSVSNRVFARLTDAPLVRSRSPPPHVPLHVFPPVRQKTSFAAKSNRAPGRKFLAALLANQQLGIVALHQAAFA
jgi:hypothetical protein